MMGETLVASELKRAGCRGRMLRYKWEFRVIVKISIVKNVNPKNTRLIPPQTLVYFWFTFFFFCRLIEIILEMKQFFFSYFTV